MKSFRRFKQSFGMLSAAAGTLLALSSPSSAQDTFKLGIVTFLSGPAAESFGVPAGKVGTVADGLALAESLGLDPLVDVGPDAPRQVRHPIAYSETPVTRYAAPPRLGEHGEEIRRWLAGG